jgi:hypothetical protein
MMLAEAKRIWTPRPRRAPRVELAPPPPPPAGFGRALYGGAGLLPPTALGTMLIWLRADNYNASSGTWTDTSGAGHNATPGTKPTLNSSDANYGGKPSVAFASASTQYLSASFGSTQAQPTTIFVVGSGTAGTFFDGIDGTNRQVLFLYATTGYWTIYAGSALTGSTSTITTASFWLAIFNTTDTLAINVKTAPGSAGTSGTTGLAGTAGLAGITIGAQEGPGTPLNGVIAEMGIYTGAMSAGNIAKLAAYVTARYGLSIGA